MRSAECVVVGGGPGGLAAARMLARAGVHAVVLEKGPAPGHKWSSHYDRLRVNTSTVTSFLPGRRVPIRQGRWPSKDQLARYYRRYAAEQGLEVWTKVEALRVDAQDDGGAWRVATTVGPVASRYVVIATSKDRTPRRPSWPGMEDFTRVVLHTSEYGNARPFTGRDVLVVGGGNSALDICLDLLDHGARTISLSLRTPPHIVRRSTFGVPNDVLALAAHRLPVPVIDRLARTIRQRTLGDLAPYGLPLPDDGLATRLVERGTIPTIDPGGFVSAVRRGRIQVVPGVERLDRTAAVLSDGRRVEADAIIAATGYRKDLEPLVGHLRVLDERGDPVVSGGRTLPHAAGLHFIGFTNVLSGNLRQIRLDAAKIAHAVSADARASSGSRSRTFSGRARPAPRGPRRRGSSARPSG